MTTSIWSTFTAALIFLSVANNQNVVAFQLVRSTLRSTRVESNVDSTRQARGLPETSSNSLVVLCSENKNKYVEGSEVPDRENLVGEQYEGSVDWDAEWKKVVENREQPEKRPGKYKSPVEIAAIKATNKVAKNVYEASREMKEKLPSAPSMSSLQGDWRFWIGILVIISFGLSILSVAGQAGVNESFYI